MGRRAKNKQPAPEPLDAKGWNPGSKRTGKRKADGEVDGKVTGTSRPLKKARTAMEEGVSHSGEKQKTKSRKSTAAGGKGKLKKKPGVLNDNTSDGWEDLEDGADLGAHKKYVQSITFFPRS
jgi:ribosomal RNA methyltransferase Nop2